jgi:hypothetical protein
VKVKRTVTISLGPYSEFLKETKGKYQQSTLHVFFKKGKTLTNNFIRKVKSMHYATVKDQSRGITVQLTKIYSLGFQHIKVMYKTYFFLSNVIWLLYIHLIELHS